MGNRWIYKISDRDGKIYIGMSQLKEKSFLSSIKKQTMNGKYEMDAHSLKIEVLDKCPMHTLRDILDKKIDYINSIEGVINKKVEITPKQKREKREEAQRKKREENNWWI